MKSTICILLCLLFSLSVTADEPGNHGATGNQGMVTLEQVRLFTEVFRTVQGAYVGDVDETELMDMAIRGMLSGLDPHSSYLDPRDFRDLEESTSGAYGGLGLEVQMRDGMLLIVAPIDGTPAERAGLRAGDMILRIDGSPVQGGSVSDAVERMRGEPGTEITITLMREGQAAPQDMTLVREQIRVTSVRARMLDEHGNGYLRISTFQSETGRQVRNELARLAREQTLNGLVLDLRSNPGGLLNAAVDVADAFLDSGRIVYTKGRLPETELSFDAKPGDLLDGAPIVVLTDVGTASAAEIVAGALQDNQRALIMGARTFGKGSVQTVVPMDHGGAVKLTTALYYTPAGRSIQASGIEPDLPLANLELRPRDASLAPTAEANLSGHLRGENEADNGPRTQRPRDAQLETDYALHEAVNILRGLHVLRQRR